MWNYLNLTPDQIEVVRAAEETWRHLTSQALPTHEFVSCLAFQLGVDYEEGYQRYYELLCVAGIQNPIAALVLQAFKAGEAITG